VILRLSARRALSCCAMPYAVPFSQSKGQGTCPLPKNHTMRSGDLRPNSPCPIWDLECELG